MREQANRIVWVAMRNTVPLVLGIVAILATLVVSGPLLADNTPGLEIHFPPNESTVRPGGSVTLNVRPVGGYAPDRLSVVSSVGTVDIVPQQEYPRHRRSYLITYAIPDDVGDSVVLTVIGVESAGGRTFSNSIVLNVEKTDPLVDLVIRNGRIHLHGTQAAEKLDVRGLYINGKEQDLSGSARGTTYLSTDPMFATIDGEGVVRAGKRDGRSTVVATNGKQSMFAHVFVDGVNGLPKFENVLDPKVKIDERLEFLVTAVDPEGTIASLKAEIIPTGATFVDNGDGTGIIRWIPSAGSTGFHDVKIVATDPTDPEMQGTGWFVIEVIP